MIEALTLIKLKDSPIKPVKIIFGFTKSTMDYGVMLYYRNRLIKAYEKVGCQKQVSVNQEVLVEIIFF